MSYPGTHVVLICFSLVTSNSLVGVQKKWAEEIEHYIEDVPRILVGTKKDLRDDNKPDPSTGIPTINH